MQIYNIETSLLRRLQVQILPDEAPPKGKIHPFSKIAVTCEPVMRFGCHLQPLGRGGAVKIFSQIMTDLISQSVTEVFVEQPLATPGSANKTDKSLFFILLSNKWFVKL